MNKYFEKTRLRALKKRDAKIYYCYCTNLCVEPESKKLYVEGLEKVASERNKLRLK